jgi:hypothetical protein
MCDLTAQDGPWPTGHYRDKTLPTQADLDQFTQDQQTEPAQQGQLSPTMVSILTWLQLAGGRNNL